MKTKNEAEAKLPDKITALEYSFVLGIIILSAVFFLPDLGQKLINQLVLDQQPASAQQK